MGACARVVLVVLVVAGTAAEGHTALDGETFAGAFVTMTKGVKCPSSSTLEFVSQLEASGPFPGVANQRGTLTLVFDDAKNVTRVTALTSEFDVNAKMKGRLSWDPATPPLTLSCDPLSLRIEGRIGYQVSEPFQAEGAADLRITSSRRGIASPYFGQLTVIFAPREP